MVKCSACGKFLSPAGAATCATCPCVYHKECVGMGCNTTICKGWVCPECNKKRRKGDNSGTPVKAIGGALAVVSTSEIDVSVSCQPDDAPILTPIQAAPRGGANDVQEEVHDMRRELADYMAELREFRKEFRESMACVGVRMDRLETRVEVLEQKEVEPMKSEITELRNDVCKLKLELNDRDQEALLSDLDIGHLPEVNGENVFHSVTLLTAKLGVPLEERDIVFAERVGALELSVTGDGGVVKRPRRIVVRLVRRQLRDDILRAARVRRGLNTADMSMSGPPARVFVNERLTRQNRLLFYQAREECRKRQWRYSWTRRGRIYVRQGDGQQAYPIRSDADLSRVFGTGVV